MPRPCTVCTSDHCHAIDKALIDGVPFRGIARQYGLSPHAIERHRKGHLPRLLAESGVAAIAPSETRHDRDTAIDSGDTASYATQRRAAHQAHAIDLGREFQEQCHRLRKLSDAIDEWLTHPDDPDRYDIGPRAAEIAVVYEDLSDCSAKGVPKRKRATLAQLLARVSEQSGGTIRPLSGEASFADPRDGLGRNARDMLSYLQVYTDMLREQYAAREVQIFQDAVIDALIDMGSEAKSRFDVALRRGIAARRTSR